MSSPTRGVLADREDAILDAHILRPDDRPRGLGRFEMFNAPEIDDDDPDHDEKVAVLLTAVAEAQSDAMELFAARSPRSGCAARQCRRRRVGGAAMPVLR
jgi:hypothetical protein